MYHQPWESQADVKVAGDVTIKGVRGSRIRRGGDGKRNNKVNEKFSTINMRQY